MKHFILTLFIFFASITFSASFCTAQFKEIPAEEVPARTLALKTGNLQDSVFWAVIGFFALNEYTFTKVSDYKILVNTVGSYFKMDLTDSLDSVVVGFVYFIPHNRLTELDLKRDGVELILNEHLCICSAKIGQAAIKISSGGFSCAGLKEEWNDIENLSIDCHDAEHRSVFFSKYYLAGLELQGALQTIPPEYIK